MKQMTRSLLVIVGMVALTSCVSSIRTSYDHTVHWKKYKSFCWIKDCEFVYTGPEYLADTVVRRYFRNAIIGTMKRKGIAYDPQYPDLLVDLHITVEKESEMFVHYSADPQVPLMALSEPHIVEYLKGTLIIDIADKKEGKMIWRSVVMGYMNVNPDLTEKNIRRGI